MKNSILRALFLLSISTIFLIVTLYIYNTTKLSQYQQIADGSVSISALNPELRDQVERTLKAIETFSLDDITRDSCDDGEFLSFKEGKIICTTLKNNSYINSTQGVQEQKGDKGDTGAQGIQGQKGDKGDTGTQGIQGQKGDVGVQGQKGDVGVQGQKGDKGDTGAQGVQGDPGVLSTNLGNGISGNVSSQILTLNLVTNSSTSGLEIASDGLTLLKSCSDGQVLKSTSGEWVCSNDQIGSVSTGNLTSATAGVTVTGGTGAVLGSGTSISIATATGSQNGLLSSTDWTTFNNKENALTFSGNGLFSRSGDTVSSKTCTTNQILVFDGSNWICGSDNNTTYTAGSGLKLSGTVFSLDPTTLTSVSSVAGGDEFILQTSGGTRRITYNDLFNGVLGSLNYQGTWNANTNSPDLSSACTAGTKGYYYVVDTAGTTNLDGISSWNIGDWVVCNGSVFDRIEATNQVNSVFGRTGTVTAQSGDYNANQITNSPNGDISSTTVQGAINELESEKISKALSSGNLLIGNGSNIATAVTMSGDATLSNAGALTIANDAITSAKILNGTITFADFSSNGCSNGQVIKYNGSAWICSSAVDTIGALDSKTKVVNGATIDSNTLYLQTADSTMPGLVSTSAQTFAGTKTLANGLVVNNPAASGAVLTIGAGGSASTLPIVITSASNQLLSFTNSGGQTIGYYSGNGSPEGVISANVGSLYTNTANGDLYTKTSGTGNTGWIKKADTYTTQYLYAKRTSSRQGPLGANEDLLLDSATGNIPYNGSTGVATLTAGKTYHFIVNTYWEDFSDTTGGAINFALVDAGTNAELSVWGQARPTSNTTAYSATGILDFIYTPASNINVKLRTQSSAGTAYLRAAALGLTSTMTITEIH